MNPSSNSAAGRYAPSPTGALHLGNLRTAMVAYAAARHVGGQFLLRVEDLDAPRTVPAAEARQLADLRALGLTWDAEPWRQSQRTAVYREALSELRAAGLAYPCFCSRRDIREALSAPHRENVEAYPGTCRDLSEHETARRIALGEQHSWRLRVAQSPTVLWDRFAGRVEIDLSQVGGDFVILRADGLFAYQLACAVDDGLSRIEEVVRGSDLLSSAARQQWVQECLGLPVPHWAHVPLLLGFDGQRLAKRHGADDLAAYAHHGCDVDAVRGLLAQTLGWAEPGERLSMDEVVRRFHWSTIPRQDVALPPMEK